MAKQPRIRTILLLVNLGVLLLPLGGVSILRFYESALLRQTESSLIAQSAFISAAYKAAFSRYYLQNPPQNKLSSYGYAAVSNIILSKLFHQRWRPRYAKLDLSSDLVLPKPAKPVTAVSKPVSAAIKAGEDTMMVMRDAQITTLAAMRIVDINGIIVATTGSDLYLSLAHWPEIQHALHGEFISVLRHRYTDNPEPSLTSISRSSKVRIFVMSPVIFQQRVIAAVTMSRTPPNIQYALYRHRSKLLIGSLILVMVVFVISIVISLNITKPLEAVTKQAKAVASGHTEEFIPLAKPKTREIAELSNAVAQMSNTLDERANYIRNFASHVSHAFKTPLTAIRGAIELLSDHSDSMSAEQKRKFLANLDDDAAYLEKLVTRLLDLARADTLSPERTSTNLIELLGYMKDRYEQNGLSVERNLDRNATTVAIERDILESILSNLFDNTRQHGGTKLSISTQLVRQNNLKDSNNVEFVKIILQDNGPGISTANAKKLFTPFFTTARKQGGTGLGLAVVKTVLKAYNGDIKLLSGKSGACFEIQLPFVS